MNRILFLFSLALVLPTLAESATIVANRAVGSGCVAPCAVFFRDSDAVASTSSGTRPIHDYRYSWNFGDTESGNWSTTGKSKNSAEGPFRGHVYETAGTYTVTLTVRNAAGTTIGTDTETITITDPDTVYTGTLTTCLNNTGDADFTGCPSGATHLNGNDLTATAVVNSAQTGERLLIKRGSSFTVSSSPVWPESTGVTIGAYGTCTSPDSAGRCSNDPHITATASVFDMDHRQDWRVVNIYVSGSSFGGVMDMQYWTILRFRQYGAILGWSHWNDNSPMTITGMAVVDSEVTHGFDYCAFLGSERLLLAGNTFATVDPQNGGSHVLRVWQSFYGDISHNRVSGAGYPTGQPSLGRHALKLHGPGYSSFSGVNEWCDPATNLQTSCLGHQTAFTVISDNIFGAAGPEPVKLGPQDSATNSYLFDLIFERNLVINDFGDQYQTDITNDMIGLSASYSSVRNNILYARTSQAELIGIHVWDNDGAPITPSHNRVLNNTIRSLDVGGGGWYTGVTIENEAVGTEARNNLASFPNLSGTANIYAVRDLASGSTASNNVLSNNPHLEDPDNSTPLSRSFALTSSSTDAIDQGYAVGVWEDFLGVTRTGTMDVGAFSYQLGGSTITCYQDADNDLYGHGVSETVESCSSGYYVASHFTSLTGDCNDSNASIHPGATDICGNGIDEDCSGSDASCGGTSSILMFNGNILKFSDNYLIY